MAFEPPAQSSHLYLYWQPAVATTLSLVLGACVVIIIWPVWAPTKPLKTWKSIIKTKGHVRNDDLVINIASMPEGRKTAQHDEIKL